MNDLKRALKEDLRRMDDISCECGLRACGNPFKNDADKHDRFFWAVSVAILHIIQWILRREKSND